MSYQPISCQSYDFIEIACLHHYALRLKLSSEKTIEGIAQTTQIHDKKEYLVLADSSGRSYEIRLDKIKKMTCLTQNGLFNTVSFN